MLYSTTEYKKVRPVYFSPDVEDWERVTVDGLVCADFSRVAAPDQRARIDALDSEMPRSSTCSPMLWRARWLRRRRTCARPTVAVPTGRALNP